MATFIFKGILMSEEFFGGTFLQRFSVLLLTKAQADQWRVHVTAAFSAVSVILFGTFFPRLSQNVTLLYKRINKENGYHF